MVEKCAEGIDRPAACAHILFQSSDKMSHFIQRRCMSVLEVSCFKDMGVFLKLDQCIRGQFTEQQYLKLPTCEFDKLNSAEGVDHKSILSKIPPKYQKLVRAEICLCRGDLCNATDPFSQYAMASHKLVLTRGKNNCSKTTTFFWMNLIFFAVLYTLFTLHITR